MVAHAQDLVHHVLDQAGCEAHRRLVEQQQRATVPERFNESILVTVHPERLVPSIVASVGVIIAVGASADKTLREFAAASKRLPEEVHVSSLEQDQVACWFVHSGEGPFSMSLLPGKAERVRHHRKYAEGYVRYNSFYFRGPAGKHN